MQEINDIKYELKVGDTITLTLYKDATETGKVKATWLARKSFYRYYANVVSYLKTTINRPDVVPDFQFLDTINFLYPAYLCGYLDAVDIYQHVRNRLFVAWIRRNYAKEYIENTQVIQKTFDHYTKEVHHEQGQTEEKECEAE